MKLSEPIKILPDPYKQQKLQLKVQTRDISAEYTTEQDEN
jgi:hypothetical protein